AQANTPAPPSGLSASDHPLDNGTHADLSWHVSPEDSSLQGYVIRQKAAGETAFTRVELLPAGSTTFTVNDLAPGKSYAFEVMAVGKDGKESSAIEASATPKVDWFDGTRVWFLITMLLFCGSVAAYVTLARRGVKFKMRKIAGLQAVDEAVGRATEMGRPC